MFLDAAKSWCDSDEVFILVKVQQGFHVQKRFVEGSWYAVLFEVQVEATRIWRRQILVELYKRFERVLRFIGGVEICEKKLKDCIQESCLQSEFCE